MVVNIASLPSTEMLETGAVAVIGRCSGAGAWCAAVLLELLESFCGSCAGEIFADTPSSRNVMPKCWTSLMVMNPVVCARGLLLYGRFTRIRWRYHQRMQTFTNRRTADTAQCTGAHSMSQARPGPLRRESQFTRLNGPFGI